MSFLHLQPVRLHRMLVPALAATLIAGTRRPAASKVTTSLLRRGAMN
jgi:hypothetical protein